MLRVLALVDGESDDCVQELVRRRLSPLASRAIVRALLVRCSGDLSSRLEASGIACAHFAIPPSPDWSAVRDTAAVARSHGTQVLYAHGAPAHALCALAGPLLGVPVVAHLTRLPGIADTHAHATCRSALIVPGEQLRAQVVASGCTRVAVVATPAAGEARAADTHASLIGWAGARRDEDGLDRFLQAAASVARARKGVAFRIAAPASVAHEVRAAAARLPASVVDLRFGSDGFARGLHVFAHTAWQASAQVTIVDALEAGAHVVAAAGAGTADLVRYGRSLTLYSPGDAAALLRARLDACDSPPASAPASAQAMPDADACAEQALRVLADSVAGTSALAA